MTSIRRRFSKWKFEHEPQIKEIKLILNQIRRNTLSVAGLAIVLVFIFAAIFAPQLSTHSPSEMNADEAKMPPSLEHYFGTNKYGVDIYSMVVHGARYDLQLSVLVTGATVIIGSIIGIFAGYFGGWLDSLLMRSTDVFFAIPQLILAIAISFALGTRSLTTVLIALIFVRWTRFARLMEGQALKVKEETYVEAARSLGSGPLRVIVRHILPNSLSPIVVTATTDIGYVLLQAASLSFLGFGAEPGAAEWGRMICDGRGLVFSCPWMIVFPGLALFIAVLGFSLLGDGLRDVFDPRLRHGELRM